MKYSLMMLALAAALLSTPSQAKADATFTVDSSLTWSGFMNVFANPLDGGGFVFNGVWGVPDLVSVFDNNAQTLTLAPNSVNDPAPFWYTPSGGPGSEGNKIMDANTYIEIPVDTLNGQNVTFQGTVLANTLSGPHTAKAFIKDFAPDFSSWNETLVDLTPGPFSISLLADAGLGRHVQYGFNFYGPNVWITDVAPFGTVVVQTVAPATTPGDFDEDGDVDGRDFLIWQRGESTTGPLDADDLADWQANYGDPGNLQALSAATVPEPASLALFAFSGLLFLRRNR
jgi:hypothetical protein